MSPKVILGAVVVLVAYETFAGKFVTGLVVLAVLALFLSQFPTIRAQFSQIAKG